jgi:hypothetical protein
MAGIKDYSTTAISNTSVGGISIAEGMLPSNINNAFRAFAADTREWYNDSQWVIYGDGDGAFTITYASATSFTVSGVDVTSFYHVGRRIKAIATTPGTIFGTISATTFSTNTTVTVTWDSGSLANEAVTIYVGALSKTNDSIPELVITNAKISASAAIDVTKIGGGAVSSTEFNYLDGVTSAIQTQLNAKQATITGGATTIVTSDLTASRALASNSSGKVAVSNVTDTELGYVSGVTSAIQTQLSGKLTAANNLSDVSSTSTARTNLGLAIGTNVQAYDADLAAIAGLTSAADKGIQFTGSGTAAVFDLTTAGKALLDDADATTQRSTLGLGTIATQNASSVNISGGAITGLASPSSNSDAATKQYVDDLLSGIRKRTTVKAASTANVAIATALENGDTLDGVTLSTGDNVLLKNQTTASQNGIYTVVASGSASRATEFDIFDELAGQLIAVQEGSTNSDTLFLCTANFGGTLGTTNITYQSLSVTALDLIQDASPQLGGDLDINGFDIVSTSNTNIEITPNGTGKVILDGLSYPTADGTNGQALITNGSGTLSFTTIQASELTTVGSVFSNYNEITADLTITTASTKNMFLMGIITVTSPAILTIAGSGTLTIL